MSSHDCPRRGSAAQLAIVRVVQLGGRAKFCHIVERLHPEHQSIKAFREQVIWALRDFGMAYVSDDQLVATDKGKDYAGRYLSAELPVVRPYVGKVAQGKAARPFRELNVARIRASAPRRIGADDHLLIPSLMGSTRKLPSGEVVE